MVARFDWHVIRRADSRIACTAGVSKPTNTPMIAITTSNSTKVKARWDLLRSKQKCPTRFAKEQWITQAQSLEHTLNRFHLMPYCLLTRPAKVYSVFCQHKSSSGQLTPLNHHNFFAIINELCSINRLSILPRCTVDFDPTISCFIKWQPEESYHYWSNLPYRIDRISKLVIASCSFSMRRALFDCLTRVAE